MNKGGCSWNTTWRNVMRESEANIDLLIYAVDPRIR